MVRRHTKGDVEFYVPGRKRPIAYSTTATSDMLKVLSDVWKINVLELRKRLDYMVGVEDEKKILDKFVEMGYGERVLRLR